MPDKNPDPNAKTTKSMFFVGPADQVFPKQKENVEPKTDSNVIKVTEHCLYALTLKGTMFSGRGSFVWGLIWMSMVVFYLFVFGATSIYLEEGKEGLPVIYELLLGGGAMLLFFNLASFWIYIRWRRILPVCFNRSTKKVSTWHAGQLFQTDWDTIEAHVKVMQVVGSHVPVKEGRLAINFYKDNNHTEENRLELPIAGTETWSMSAREAGFMIWEYIRLFMEEGKQAIPEPVPTNAINTWVDVFKVYNPFPIIREGSDTFGWKLFNVLVFPFSLALAPIFIPTELIYMWLDNTLPKRKPPKELQEACKARRAA